MGRIAVKVDKLPIVANGAAEETVRKLLDHPLGSILFSSFLAIFLPSLRMHNYAKASVAVVCLFGCCCGVAVSTF